MNSINNNITVTSDNIVLENKNKELFDKINNHFEKSKKSKSIIDPYTGLPTKKHIEECKKRKELEKEKLEKEKLEKEKLEQERLEKERLENEKIRKEKSQAMEIILFYVDKACDAHVFGKCEEYYNIHSQVLIINDFNQSDENKGKALEFLIKAIRIANKKGAFELEESFKIGSCINIFLEK